MPVEPIPNLYVMGRLSTTGLIRGPSPDDRRIVHRSAQPRRRRRHTLGVVKKLYLLSC